MRLKGILTERHIKKGASFQIVSEWEDAISDHMHIPQYETKKYLHFIIRNIVRLRLGWLFLFIDSLRPINSYYLHFDMEATSYLRVPSIKNIIPIIIDFWLPKTEFKAFYSIHRNAKLIFITSKEVYDLLKADKCPLPIFHLPVSIPDKYVASELLNYTKTIDFIFAGRKDPKFFEYVKLYEKENPDIEYVYKEFDNDTAYVSNKRGRLRQDCDSREEYTTLIRSSKVAFYVTPGIDPSKEHANGYNQVTPRFLELISNGCIVMARYPENSDVHFFQLNEICFKVDSYHDFKNYIGLFFDKNFVKSHLDKYYPYLKKHSTTARLYLLEQILNTTELDIR